MIHEINLRSSNRDEMMDITSQVQRIVTQEAINHNQAFEDCCPYTWTSEINTD